MGTRNLDAIFAPESVAIAGATDRPGSTGAQVTENLVSSFKGRLYGVNPRRPQIAGLEMHGDVENLPEAPDLAVIVTPPEAVVETAEAFAAKGTRGCIVITDLRRGAARAAVLRTALRDLADATGMRIVGPNALGIASRSLRATMSSLVAPEGSIAFVGQATMAAGVVAVWAAQQHVGFSNLAAAGDMCDVDFADLIDWFAADARTRQIVVFLERIAEPRKLISAIRMAARMKPVLVLRAPAEQLDPDADAVFDAALRRAGALRARNLEDLFAAMEAVAVRLPSDAAPTFGRRLAVLSNGESLGALARMEMEDSEVEPAMLGDETVDRIMAIMPPGRRRTNPIDILPDASPERYANAMKALLADSGVDAVLAVFGPSGAATAEHVADAIAAVVKDARLQPGRRRPFVMTAFAGGHHELAARDALGRQHIPAFETPASAVRAYSALVALRAAAARVTATPEFVATLESAHAVEVSEKAALALEKGQSAIDGAIASSIRRALWLGKTDAPPPLTWRICVTDDPDFGPAIFFGPGGAFAPIILHRAAALPPLNAATAQELIASSRHASAARAAGLLDDGACYALAALLVRVSDLIATVPEIRTLTIDHISAADGRPVVPAEAVSGAVAALAVGQPDARFAIRPYPAKLIEKVVAADGLIYRLRPMRAEDEPALGQMGARMSAEDLRLRFFQPMRQLSHELAARLTQIDYDREMAFALEAPDGSGTGGGILGVVRLHREARGDTAEFAVTVRSDQQGKGFGRLLMERIIAYARTQNLKSIFGIVLHENQGMLKLSRKLGFTARSERGDATVVRVELKLETP
ncbi:MAG: GNAT family N-acetyltransferase [Micropepsaceae bacterium]